MSGQVAHRAAVRLLTALRWLTATLLLTASAWAQDLELRVFDVGQGDAVLIQAASGQAVLYDGGRSADGALRHLRRAGVERLDLVIASHADADHIGGLPAVLRAYRPRFFMDNGVAHTTQAYGRLLTSVAEAGSELLAPTVRTIGLGEASLRVLPPSGDPERGQNFNSIGLVVEVGRFRAALTGDAEPAALARWERLLADGLPSVAVYRASHHGSRNGDTREILQALAPEVVIVSAGAGNPYGHPHEEALLRYADGGASIYRTDRHGTIHVSAWADGRHRVETERKAPTEPLGDERATTEAAQRSSDDAPAPGGVAPGGMEDPPLRLTCVHYDPNSRAQDRERVTLRAEREIDVAGWYVEDEAGHAFPLDDTTLAAGDELVLTNGGGPAWNNAGDTAYLREQGGQLVDALRYAGGGSGRACR